MGFLSDRLAADHLIIGSFGIRMAAALSFSMLDVPFGKLFQLIVIVGINSTYCEQLIADRLLVKNMPGDIRVVVKGAVHSFALFAAFVFHIIVGKIVESGLSARAPFFIVAGLDAIIVFFVFFSSLLDVSEKFSRKPKKFGKVTAKNKIMALKQADQ